MFKITQHKTNFQSHVELMRSDEQQRSSFPFKRTTFEGVLLIMHTGTFSFKVTGPGASGCAAHVCVTPVVYERRSSEDERGGGGAKGGGGVQTRCLCCLPMRNPVNR